MRYKRAELIAEIETAYSARKRHADVANERAQREWDAKADEWRRKEGLILASMFQALASNATNGVLVTKEHLGFEFLKPNDSVAALLWDERKRPKDAEPLREPDTEVLLKFLKVVVSSDEISPYILEKSGFARLRTYLHNPENNR